MNTYDFDETILKGDSEIYFLEYLYKTYPASKKYAKSINFYKFLYQKKIVSKEYYYNKKYPRILKYIPDLNTFLEAFWDEYQINVKAFYKKQQKDDDVIISATPEFILSPLMKRLNINHLIASQVDTKTGKVIGKLVYGQEKVNQFIKHYPNIIPDTFYSDSNTDLPMAKLAKTAFKVLDDNINNWDF